MLEEVKITLPFGNKTLSVDLKQRAEITPTRRHDLPELSQNEIRKCIEMTVENLRAAKVVAVAIPDHTRPGITRWILPEMVEIFEDAGVEEIRLCVGTGLHNPPPNDEMYSLIHEKVRSHSLVKVYVHDAHAEDHLTFLGYTSFKTPVWIMKEYCEAEVKIAVSLVEAHQFAGFSGGAKAVAIGLGGEKTISANHSKLANPGVEMGKLDGNPVREEIEEIGNMVGIDFLINAVINDRGIPVTLFCGSNPEAFRKACEFIKRLSGVKVEKLYDAVIVSPGGYPRDIDLYQAQKALPVAEAFCKPGGTIILTAECKAGYGENTYVKLLKDAESPETLINTFDFSHFKAGPHKAYLLARTLSRYEVRIVSSLPHEELKATFFNPYQTLEEALKDIPESANVLVIPNSSQLIPLKEN